MEEEVLTEITITMGEEVLTEITITDENKEELESLYGVIPEEVQEKYNYENEVEE